MRATKMVEDFLEATLTPEQEAEALLELAADPDGAEAIRQVLAARGLFPANAWAKLKARVEADLFAPADSRNRLAEMWESLKTSVESLLATAREIAQPPLQPALSYLDDGAAYRPGELRIDARTGPGAYREIASVRFAPGEPQPLPVRPGEILRFRFHPTAAGRGFAFAERDSWPPRLVYPNQPDQPTYIAPDKPLELFWEVDQSPRRLRLIFVLAEAAALGDDPTGGLVKAPDGGWDPESESRLVGRLAATKKIMLEAAEIWLAVVD